MFSRLFASAVALSVLSGCVSVQPILGHETAADPASGYVAGQFSRTKSVGYAYVIKAVDSDAEYTMSMGEDSTMPKAITSQTVAIKLPPGTYTVSKWVTYGTLTKEVVMRRPVTNPILSTPFKIVPGTVLHLGSYSTTTEQEYAYPRTTMHMKIRPIPVTEGDMKSTFALAYPNLASQPFSCLLCVDTIGRTVAGK